MRLGELIAARDEKVAAIDAQLVDVEAQRGPSVEGLPEDLLALYEKLRAAKGGVGAASCTSAAAPAASSASTTPSSR